MAKTATVLLSGALLLAVGCESNQSRLIPVKPDNPPAPAVVSKSEVPKDLEPRKFLVFVNYEAELKDVVESGQYAFKNRQLTSENFPSCEIGEKDIELFLIQPGYSTDSESFLDELWASGLRPATAIELMAFGRQYRYFLSENPVLALGSYFVDWDSFTYVACFYSNGLLRIADVRMLTDSLPRNAVFAVVPE